MKNLFYYAKNFSYNALPKAFFCWNYKRLRKIEESADQGILKKRLDYYFKIKTPFSIPKKIQEIQYFKRNQGTGYYLDLKEFLHYFKPKTKFAYHFGDETNINPFPTLIKARPITGDNKNSILFKNSDIRLLIPEVKEAGLDMIPTSSTINQLSIGDALAISTLKKKKINNLDFKKFHPSGSLGEKLRTVEDLMLTKNKIPFIDQDMSMKKALKIMTEKKLGTLIAQNKKKFTTGIITDGQIRKLNSKNISMNLLKVKDVMTKNPIKVERNTLATKALSIMNEKKITSLCVYDQKKKSTTIGIVHVHNILNKKIY